MFVSCVIDTKKISWCHVNVTSMSLILGSVVKVCFAHADITLTHNHVFDSVCPINMALLLNRPKNTIFDTTCSFVAHRLTCVFVYKNTYICTCNLALTQSTRRVTIAYQYRNGCAKLASTVTGPATGRVSRLHVETHSRLFGSIGSVGVVRIPTGFTVDGSIRDSIC